MQISNKPIKDWKRILLDTTVLCALFRAQFEINDETTLFVKKLIDYLGNSKSGDGSERIYYISTITLGELLTKEQDQEKIKKILKVLKSTNVRFVGFDTDIAMKFNIVLADKLHKSVLNKRAAALGWKTNEFLDAREWIIKDYMIAMSGTTKDIDIILTADKNTFYPLTKDIPNSSCILSYPCLFQHTDQFIIEYDYNNVDNFISNIPFQTLNEIEATKPVPPSKPVQVSLFGEQQNIL